MTPAGTSGCSEVRQALGVYVVGAIDPAERSVVDRHLAGCSACRDELAGLAGLPALLGRVTLQEAERGQSEAAVAEVPPTRLLDSMLTRMQTQRKDRRRRNVLVAIAASVVVLAGSGAAAAAIGSAATSGQQHGGTVQAVWDKASGRNAATNATASVRYRRQNWGTEMYVWVSGIPAGTKCQLVVVNSAGLRAVAGGWQAPRSGQSTWYPGSAPFTAASITGFQITANGKTLVTASS